jgi:hypothetical protein
VSQQIITAPAWQKSSRSTAMANCVEVKRAWRKSARSGADADCVEVAPAQS